MGPLNSTKVRSASDVAALSRFFTAIKKVSFGKRWKKQVDLEI